MSDRSKPKIECFSCGMQKPLCLCDFVRPIRVETRVTVIIPYLEWYKTSNTGRLAGVCLENSLLLIRGERGCRFDPAPALCADRSNLVLFPGGEDIESWRSRNPSVPVNLIVPDGTWESSARILAREPLLAAPARVSLPPPGHLPPRLRKSGFAERMSTLEAVAGALAFLEGEEPALRLLETLRVKTDRVLWARGKLRTGEVYGGIPAGARIWKTASGRTPGSSGGET